jgi:hypothetical protein
VDGFLAALGFTKGATIGGFLGAVVSLRFMSNLNWLEACFTLMCGTVTAAYLTPLFIVWGGGSPSHDGPVGFLVGVFGMAVGAAIIAEIPAVIVMAKEKFLK